MNTGEHPTETEMFGWLMHFFAKGENEAVKAYPGVRAHFACFRSECRDQARRALALTEVHKNHETVAESYEQKKEELFLRYWL